MIVPPATIGDARRRPARPLRRRRRPPDGLRHARARPRPGAPAGPRRRPPPRRRRTTTRRALDALGGDVRGRHDRVREPAGGGARAAGRRRTSSRPSAAPSRSPRTASPRRRSSPRIGVADRAVVASPQRATASPLGDPAIVKTARLGYDGKGQVRRRRRRRARRGAGPSSARRRASSSGASPLDVELSVVVARTADGRTAAYPVAENHHADGILDLTVVPARIDGDAGGDGDGARRRGSPTPSTTSACSPSSCSSATAGCSSTSSRRARTTAATGRSTPRSRASSPSRSAPCAALALGATDDDRAGAVRWSTCSATCWRRTASRDWAAALADPDARLHLYGKAEAAARPQDGPPHGARRMPPTTSPRGPSSCRAAVTR